MVQNQTLDELLHDIRACRLCADHLPLGPRPVLQASSNARIVIAGQAPGTKVHKTGKPFDDPSGDRLRDWMGIDHATFYDPAKINIIPMGFCYPGRMPRGGDAPPRPECAQTWRARLFSHLAEPKLLLVIGQFAIDYHLGEKRHKTLADTVRNWPDYGPGILPMPHPSPRNRLWLSKNAWFEAEIVPMLRQRVKEALA